MVYVENLCAEDIVEEHMMMKSADTSDGEEGDDEESGSESEESGDDDNHDSVAPGQECSNNELQILYNAACIVRNKLQNTPDLKVPWPPLASDLTVENSKKIIPVAMFNMLAWICGFSLEEPQIKDYIILEDRHTCKLLSVAQDLIYVASDGKKLTPKGLSLGMTIRQLTGSASAISLVNRLGHCVSHTTVLRHETALAQRNISLSTLLPPGFASQTSTTLAWDNDDFQEETRTGKGTTHITGGIIIQRMSPAQFIDETRESLPRSKSISTPAEKVDSFVLGKKVTRDLSTAAVNVKIDEKDHVDAQHESRQLDLAFALCRAFCKERSILLLPNWTGFNTILKSNAIPMLSKIGYLPIIDASPTELSTVNEILERSLQIADSLQLQYICLVFDEAIYSKVQQIRWKKEAYMNRLIVRLGDFHMAMSFCGALSKLFKDAGLKVSIYSTLVKRS